RKPEATDEAAAKARQKSEQKSEKGSANPDGEHFEEAVKSAAEATTALEAHADDKSAKVEVITRRHALGPEAVAGEAGKGYDLLVVGIANTRDPNGGFSKDLALNTQSFEGTLAVVDTRSRGQDKGRDPARPVHCRSLITV